VISNPASALADIKDTFAAYDIPQPILDDLTSYLAKSSKLSDFLMHFHHHVSEPASSRAFTCALTIALGYFFGGFFPLLPYFFVGNDGILVALCWSIGSMVLALFSFGYVKTCFVQGWTGRSNVIKGIYGGFQMTFIGSLATGMAMALVKGFDSLAQE
jgi:VIT1/CCC1 family predicted Fe2+/Mn2+ transporter